MLSAVKVFWVVLVEIVLFYFTVFFVSPFALCKPRRWLSCNHYNVGSLRNQTSGIKYTGMAPPAGESCKSLMFKMTPCAGPGT